MKYRVIKFFTDLQDNNHAYNVGDAYPHIGAKASKERIEELASAKNRQRQPLIEAVKEEVKIEEVKEEEQKPKKRSKKNAE